MYHNLWNIFEVLVDIYEGFNIYYFIFSFLDYNFKKQKNKIIFSCGALIHACLVLFFNMLMFYEGAWGSIYIIFTFIYTLIFVHRGVIKTFFATMLAYIWLLSINAFFNVFISSIADFNLVALYTEQNVERFVFILSVQLFVTYIYRLMLKIFKKNEIRLQAREWLLILIVFLLSFCIILMIHAVQLNCHFSVKYHNLLLLSSFGLILINVVCYYMIIELSKANAMKMEHELLLMESNYRKQYAENVKNQYEEIRRIQHDMKHSYYVIQQLVVEERYEELQQYLPQMSKQICFAESMVTTNHAIINAILNLKLSTAKKQGIKTLCNTIKDFHIEQVDEVDLCHLLGNLLDNAIEAVAQCSSGKTKYMEISITERNQFLFIIVKNSYNQEKLPPDLQTSKLNKIEHGFGVKTIKRIAKKYNGFADFYIENDLFCCNVTLQIK